MHWMSVKSWDNFQIREHSWPRLFHIIYTYMIATQWQYGRHSTCILLFNNSHIYPQNDMHFHDKERKILQTSIFTKHAWYKYNPTKYCTIAEIYNWRYIIQINNTWSKQRLSLFCNRKYRNQCRSRYLFPRTNKRCLSWWKI